jgi:peptide/nickel transport system permease protein
MTSRSRILGFTRYVAKRLLGLVLVMWLVATLVFLILRLIPGDPVQIIAGIDVVDPEILQEMRVELGLDRPLWAQYLDWLANLARGDLGVSIRTRTPVTELVARAFPVTLELALIAFAIGVGISIPAGVLAARKKGKMADAAITSTALVGISLPSFVLALLAILVFSVRLRWLPSTGYVSPTEDLVENLRLMILPAFTLGLVTSGILMRMMRRNLIDQMEEDYVRTARSKGAGENRVFYGHAMRNALIPYVTIAGIEAGILISGSVITETIFAIPGMGRLMIANIYDRDYPVVQGTVFVVAATYVLINFVVDLLYAWLDPRVSLQ